MNVEVCPIDADYVEEDGKGIVRIFCKDKSGRSIVLLDDSFIPYFYILPKAGKEDDVIKRIKALKQRFGILNIEIVKKKIGIEEKTFIKVYAKTPSDLYKIRDIVKLWESKRGGAGVVIEEYEYSIPHAKRYLIEKDISPMKWYSVQCEPVKNNIFVSDITAKIRSIKPAENASLPRLKLLAFDIENVEKDGKQNIIMISLVGNEGVCGMRKLKKVLTFQHEKYDNDLHVECLKDEKVMLERFVEIVNDYRPDIILGFMSDQHDFKLIQERAHELKVKINLAKDSSVLKFSRRAHFSTAKFAGLVHIDLFTFILNILSTQLQTEVMTLQSISSELLGDSKIEMEFEEILTAWRDRKNLNRLAQYCLKDSELVLRLAEHILPQIFWLCRIVGQGPYDVSRMTYSQLVEWYLTKQAYKMNYVIPNQPKFEEIEERRVRTPYAGGYVKSPIPGIHEDIAVIDFRSLYPSLIATFNISPEVLKCCDKKDSYVVPEGDYWFCKRYKGFVSSVIKNLIALRAEIKHIMKNAKPNSQQWRMLNEEQQSIKIITNAIYGYYAFASSKWYSVECAASAAAFGRYYIKKTIDEAEKFGFVVIYADTDSAFLKLGNGKGLEKKVNEFLNKINRQLPGIMELDLQGFYKRGIFIPKEAGFGTAKKKYALIDKNGGILIRGLERVRADWCRLARYTQEEVLKCILVKKDIEGAINVIKTAIERVRAHKIPLKELTIFEQLSKPLSEYKTIGPHVVVAQKMLRAGRPVGEGMVIMYVITRGKGTVSERAEPVEDVELSDIDVDYYITKQIIPPSLRVLAALGITKEGLYKKLGLRCENG